MLPHRFDWYSRKIASKAKAILDSDRLAFAGADVPSRHDGHKTLQSLFI